MSGSQQDLPVRRRSVGFWLAIAMLTIGIASVTYLTFWGGS